MHILLRLYKFNAYINFVMFYEYRCMKRKEKNLYTIHTLSDYITGDHRNMDVVSTLSEQKFGIA